MFVHEAELAMPAVDAALVVVDSVSGVQVVTQKVWNYADDAQAPPHRRLHPHGPRARRL